MTKYKYPYDERFTEQYLYNRFNWINHRDYIHPYISKQKSWLHGLHLDFYKPSWHQAIELNGRQHIKPTNWNGKISYSSQQLNLFKQTGRDIIKQNLCLKDHVHIIAINIDFQRKSTIRKHITSKLDKDLKPLNYIKSSKKFKSSKSIRQIRHRNETPNLFYKALQPLKNNSNRFYLNRDFILNSHYSLSLLEQKILTYLIFNIRLVKDKLISIFSISNFIDYFNYETGGHTYLRIKQNLHNLVNNYFYIDIDGSKPLKQKWITNVILISKGQYKCIFPEYLYQYLIRGSSNIMPVYKLTDVCKMTREYSPRLFEIFSSGQYEQRNKQEGINYSIDGLKYTLNLMKRNTKNKVKMNDLGEIIYKYPRFTDFNKRVLKPAITDINKWTRYNIKINHMIKNSRKVVGLNIVMKYKE